MKSKKMKPLMDTAFEKMEWKNFLKEFPVIRIATALDGSCLFHAIAKAYFKPYIMGKVKDQVFDRQEFVKTLRKDLSVALGNKVDVKNPKSKTFYQTLANGELEEISKTMPEYSLENMQKELNSNLPVSNYFNEFISNQLDVDIYILDGRKKDVYMTGSDLKLLYKGRKSIVILYLPGHYELVGLMADQTNVETCFSPSHPFIAAIRQRIESKLD